MRKKKKKRYTLKRGYWFLTVGTVIGYVASVIVIRTLSRIRLVEWNYFKDSLLVTAVMVIVMCIVGYIYDRVNEKKIA